MISKIEHLEWDSDFFELAIKKVSIEGSVTQADMESIKKTEADLVYIFLFQDSGINRERIEELGGLFVDQRVTFEKKLREVSALPNHIYFSMVEANSPQLEQLTWQSGEFSRFNLDKGLKPYYRKLYSRWLEKSISKELAVEVWIASSAKGGKPEGFITLSKNGKTGQIGLIAVDSAARGKGLGLALVTMADNRFKAWGLRSAKVITQGANLAAAGLYERIGYTCTEKQPIYHLWKNKL